MEIQSGLVYLLKKYINTKPVKRLHPFDPIVSG